MPLLPEGEADVVRVPRGQHPLDEPEREHRGDHLHVLVDVLDLVYDVPPQVLEPGRDPAVDHVDGTAPAVRFRPDLAKRVGAVGQRVVPVHERRLDGGDLPQGGPVLHPDGAVVVRADVDAGHGPVALVAVHFAGVAAREGGLGFPGRGGVGFLGGGGYGGGTAAGPRRSGLRPRLPASLVSVLIEGVIGVIAGPFGEDAPATCGAPSRRRLVSGGEGAGRVARGDAGQRERRDDRRGAIAMPTRRLLLTSSSHSRRRQRVGSVRDAAAVNRDPAHGSLHQHDHAPWAMVL
mmetsp:Transcript_11014/g.25622  ORF Transcript_11014/g.25622 Transcript_11014/m.25622 type:complete len:291 (+) Transcript_11014:137-1009(+)